MGSYENTSTDTEWRTTREAAHHLAVPPRQLYRLIDQGDLDAFKVGGDLKLRRGDVARYAGSTPPTT